MFKTKQADYGGSYIIWNARDKKMVREAVLESFRKMKLPRTMEAKLTRIKWANAYLKNNNEFFFET